MNKNKLVWGALALALGACGSSKSNGNMDMGPGGGDMASCMPTSSRKFYIDSVSVPANKTQFALDLNGDGKADNQLGDIVVALRSQNQDVQLSVNNAVMAGTVVMLFKEGSSDPTYTTDACATTTLYAGQNQVPGTGPYTIDTAIAPASFSGTLASSSFNSTPPTAPPDVQMTLPLPILPGQIIKVPLHGAHVQYLALTTGVMNGQVNGGVTKADIDNVVVPGLAAGFESLVQANPGSPDAMTILNTFDMGGASCQNPDGSTSTPHDGHIGTCEVADNALVQALLAPDVQLFQNGVYNPNPANADKDAVSVGVAFTATPAMF